jgi:metal-responsive CopG/Arc/MetJ family transcriptional regulator
MMKNIQNKWRSVVPTALPKPKRVVIDFPEPLLVEAERAAHELKINRSSLIREAVKQFLKRRQRIKLEKALVEGYVANAASAVSGANSMMGAESDFR